MTFKPLDFLLRIYNYLTYKVKQKIIKVKGIALVQHFFIDIKL